jgi:hypothetical protein
MIHRLSNLQPVSTKVAEDEAQDHDRTPLNIVRKDSKRPTAPPESRSSDIDWEKHYIHPVVRDSMASMRCSSIALRTFFVKVPHHLSLCISNNTKSLIRVLCVILAIIIPADILRFRYSRFARLYESQLSFLMRESEKVGFKSVGSFAK